MVLEEQPSKVAEAVKLFLQGLGYTTVRGLGKLRSASLANTPIKRALQGKPLQQQPQTAELIEGLQELVLSKQHAPTSSKVI